MPPGRRRRSWRSAGRPVSSALHCIRCCSGGAPASQPASDALQVPEALHRYVSDFVNGCPSDSGWRRVRLRQSRFGGATVHPVHIKNMMSAALLAASIASVSKYFCRVIHQDNIAVCCNARSGLIGCPVRDHGCGVEWSRVQAPAPTNGFPQPIVKPTGRPGA